jgi:hypothetical protein
VQGMAKVRKNIITVDFTNDFEKLICADEKRL